MLCFNWEERVFRYLGGYCYLIQQRMRIEKILVNVSTGKRREDEEKPVLGGTEREVCRDKE